MTEYEFYLALAAIIVVPPCLVLYTWILVKGGLPSARGYKDYLPSRNKYDSVTITKYYKPYKETKDDQTNSKAKPTPTQETKG